MGKLLATKCAGKRKMTKVINKIQEFPEQQKAVVFYRLQNYKFKEIAKILDISIHTAYWHSKEARKKLQSPKNKKRYE